MIALSDCRQDGSECGRIGIRYHNSIVVLRVDGSVFIEPYLNFMQNL